jgi:hypothetical protein
MNLSKAEYRKHAIELVDRVSDLQKQVLIKHTTAILEGVHEEIQELQAEAERLRDAANVALGHLTGGMDGDWRDCDPIQLLRDALSS